jgi:hypothetical protein
MGWLLGWLLQSHVLTCVGMGSCFVWAVIIGCLLYQYDTTFFGCCFVQLHRQDAEVLLKHGTTVGSVIG